MRHVFLIMTRELKAYVRSPLGYAIAAATLLVGGIYFIAGALGDPGTKMLSAMVLAKTFEGISGVIMIAGIVLSMRVVAVEQEHGTLVLLKTSPVSDRAVILGKYAATMVVMTLITVLTFYMPALVWKVGKVSWGQIAVGYIGILLLASATVSVGIFASSLVKSQVLAIIIAGAIQACLVLMWMVARETEPPISDFLNGLAIHHLHQRDFMTGVLRLDNVAYYVVMTFGFLLAATKTLEARRWR